MLLTAAEAPDRAIQADVAHALKELAHLSHEHGLLLAARGGARGLNALLLSTDPKTLGATLSALAAIAQAMEAEAADAGAPAAAPALKKGLTSRRLLAEGDALSTARRAMRARDSETDVLQLG